MCLWEVFTCKDLFPHHSDYDEFMDAICNKGERPLIPRNCPPSLKHLLDDCWQKDANARPSFTEINTRLNEILIEVAISDHDGRAFWKEKFVQGPKLQKMVRFDKDFAPALYRYLGLGPLPKDNNKKGTTDPAALNFRALRALIAKPDPGDPTVDLVEIQHFGRILEWFGPFKHERGHETMLDRMRSSCTLPYFHGDVETKAAERLLSGKPVGTFLIRFSTSSPGGYAITRVGKDGSIKNVKIMRREGHQFCLTEKGRAYPALEALVVELKDQFELHIPCLGSKYERLGLEEEAGGYEVVDAEEEEEEVAGI